MHIEDRAVIVYKREERPPCEVRGKKKRKEKKTIYRTLPLFTMSVRVFTVPDPEAPRTRTPDTMLPSRDTMS